jgi:hypothetical protein
VTGAAIVVADGREGAGRVGGDGDLARFSVVGIEIDSERFDE